jgi:hypothetical protein
MSKQIELIQSLSLGLLLAVAVSIGCGILVIGCYSLYEEYMEGPVPSRFSYQNEQLRVLSDGRPLIEVTQYNPPRQTKYLDVHRNPVQLPDEPEWTEGALLPEKHRLFLNFHRRFPQARIISVVQSLHDTEDWYFVFEDKREGHGYFVAFDFRTRERLGYLGKQGFQNDPLPEAEQFRIDGLGLPSFRVASFINGAFFVNLDGLAFLQSGNKLFLINLKSRTARLLLGDKDVLSIATVQKPGAIRSDGLLTDEVLLAIRTKRDVLLLDFSGKQRQTFELPTNFSARGFDFHLLPDGNALLVANSGKQRETGQGYVELDSDLLWMTPQGEITKRQKLTLRSRRNIQHLSDRAQACLFTMAVPAPLTGGTMALVLRPWSDSQLIEKPYAEAVTKSLQDTWPALLSLLILASGLTYLTERRQRKYGLPRSYAWLVFVFLLGLPGYIAYLVHRPWPLADPLPPPDRTGLEVFT